MIEIDSVTKVFANGYTALDKVSVSIKKGEFFSLLGPSGCGKTTLLRMIAGFLYPDSGRILIDGQDISFDPPYKRKVNMVFQSYAVFPHMNVFDNVAYGLVIDGHSKKEQQILVSEALELVQLVGYEKSFPDELSGGQRQRVAVARALAKKPKALLLDEPLSALDAKLRESMRSELVKIQKRSGVTFLFVTHDQHEAMGLANRISVMKSGVLLQTGNPFEIYEEPKTSFIADFIGSTNLLSATRVDGSQIEIEAIGKIAFSVPPDFPSKFFVTLRPEKICIGLHPPADKIVCEGFIDEILYLGDKTTLRVKLNNGNFMNCSLSEIERREIHGLTENDKIYCYWEQSDIRVLPE